MLLFHCLLLMFVLEYHFSLLNSYILLLFLSLALYFFIDWFLRFFWGIEISAGLDSITHYDLEENRSHIVSCAIFKERIDPLKVSSIIKERAFTHQVYEKLKKVMKTYFFIDYWTYADHFNIEDHIEIISKKFDSLDDLYGFMTLHASEKAFPTDKPKWKIFILINLFNGQSAVIEKFHHAIGDGVALMSFTFHLADCGDYTTVNLPKINTWHRVLITPIGLIKALYFTLFYLFQKKDVNKFKKVSLSGQKSGFGSLKFDLKLLKEYSKKLGVNLNDVILALINQSLRNCYHERYHDTLCEFKIFVAASLRGLPKPGDHFPLTNHTNFLTLEEFPHVKSSFEQLINKYHSILKTLKQSYDIYFRGFYIELVSALIPKSYSLFIANLATDKSTCIFTSVPGPIKTISMFGYEVENLFFFVNSPGLVAILINVFTYNEKLSICCLADKSTGLETKNFIQELERVFEMEVINSPIMK